VRKITAPSTCPRAPARLHPYQPLSTRADRSP